MRDALLLLVVVVLVEVIDVLLCLLDGLFSLRSELFSALGNLVVTTLPPLLDDLGLFLFLGESLIPGVVAYGRSSCNGGSTGDTSTLFVEVSSSIQSV